jgi:hypothetical protein
MEKDIVKRSGGNSNANFLALILIGIGVVWLLGQSGIFRTESFAVLARFWPLILVAIGANLLIGRGDARISLIIGVITVGLFLVLMLLGPSLGLAQQAEIKTAAFSESVEGAERADINLDLSLGTTTINTLSDSNNLITADLRYLGDVRFDVEGDAEREVRLAQQGSVSGGDFIGFPFFNFDSEDQDLRWDIRLNPDVPMTLNISGGVGRSELDLSALTLTAFDLKAGVGEANISLPDTGSSYTATIDGGVGAVRLTIEEGAAMLLDINGGVGEIAIDVPDGAAVRLEASEGLGSVNVSGGLENVRESDNRSEWETPGYADAAEDQRIRILYDGGVGSLNVR